MKNYWIARGYAYKLAPNQYRDIVHDAYLTWFNKTQKNLFNEPIGTILRVIKLTFYRTLSRNKFMWRGKIASRQVIPLSTTDYNHEEDKSISLSNQEDLFTQLQYQQDLKHFEDTLPKTQLEVMKLSITGYKPSEIAVQLNKSRQAVNGSLNHVRNKVLKLHN